MLELTDKQIAAYFRRSYTAADGLWFLKVEERYGFDTALDVDEEVWKVLPKIQARMLKSIGNLDNGLEALGECLTTRLTLDGFTFESEQSHDGTALKITIRECPWHNVMLQARREHLSDKVGTRICNAEYRVWASEFGDDMDFEIQEQICSGGESCTLLFRASR